MNKFQDITNLKLRNYNIAMYALNLNSAYGEGKTREYLESFEEVERNSIFAMLLAIKHYGSKKVIDTIRGV